MFAFSRRKTRCEERAEERASERASEPIKLGPSATYAFLPSENALPPLFGAWRRTVLLSHDAKQMKEKGEASS